MLTSSKDAIFMTFRSPISVGHEARKTVAKILEFSARTNTGPKAQTNKFKILNLSGALLISFEAIAL